MNGKKFTFDWARHLIIYLCLASMLTSFYTPTHLQADYYDDFDLNEQERNQVAVGLVGVTVVGLAAIIGCIAAGTGHSRHSHHHHHGSCYSYYSSCYDSYYSDYSCSDCTDCYSYSYTSGLDSLLSNQTVASITDKTLSGVFISNPDLNTIGQGSFTPFIQLPDGTANTLDSLSFTDTNSTTPFGPFNQKGTYIFGIMVNPGTVLSADARVGFVNINVDGTNVESGEFILPAYPKANFTPTPVYFSLF